MNEDEAYDDWRDSLTAEEWAERERQLAEDAASIHAKLVPSGLKLRGACRPSRPSR